MSHFYLTLPSNSSEEFFPDNTLTRFTTKLHNDISLTGDWAVGLTEFFYPRNWYNVENQFLRIACNNCTITPDLKPDETLTPSYDIHVGIPSGYYHSIPDLVDTIKSSITKVFRRPIAAWSSRGVERFVDKSQWPDIRYVSHNQKVILTMQPSMTIRLSEKLSTILGIETFRPSSTSESLVKSTYTCDIEGGLHALYMYADIVECTSVGDSVVPLLRVIQITGQRGEMTHIQYERPRYVPVQKKEFDSIEIDIRDDLGQPVSFDSGKLIVILHFRRAKEAYFLG